MMSPLAHQGELQLLHLPRPVPRLMEIGGHDLIFNSFPRASNFENGRTLLRSLPQALPPGHESEDEDSLLAETLVSDMSSTLSLRFV